MGLFEICRPWDDPLYVYSKYVQLKPFSQIRFLNVAAFTVLQLRKIPKSVRLIFQDIEGEVLDILCEHDDLIHTRAPD